MKTLIAFIAGVFVGWWMKPKPKKTAKFVFVGEGKPYFDKEMWAEPIPEQEEAHTSSTKNKYVWDEPSYDCGEPFGKSSLADTQPIKVRYTAEEIQQLNYNWMIPPSRLSSAEGEK